MTRIVIYLFAIFLGTVTPCVAKDFHTLSSNIDLQSQLTKDNTVYEIREDFKIESKLIIPYNSTLLFRGGSIIGGDIYFNSTTLDGDVCFTSIGKVEGIIVNETILTRWFNGVDDLFRIINLLCASNDNKRIIVEAKEYIVRNPLLIRRRTGIDLDFNGAVIKDETQGDSKLLHRANPMIFIRASKNISIRNMNYEVSKKRHFGEIGTCVICIGATSADWDEDTYNINILNVEGRGDLVIETVKEKQIASGFISINGNTHDVTIENVSYTGNVGHLCNIEYGLAPDVAKTYKEKYKITLPDYYGLHPYNIRVNNITGYNSPKSYGYLRTSSCYNVIFENCYGYNVNRLFYLYSGDQSINRVNGSVIVRNCASYINDEYSNTSLYGMMIQNVYINPNSKVPHEKGIRHNISYIVENCEFQGLLGKSGSGVLLTGDDGGVVFRNVTIRNFDTAFDSYADNRQERYCNLIIENCLFDSNKKGLNLSGMKNPRIASTRFFPNQKSGAQITISANTENVSITDCEFASDSKFKSIIVEESAGSGHLISKSRFSNGISKSLDDKENKVVVE